MPIKTIQNGVAVGSIIASSLIGAGGQPRPARPIMHNFIAAAAVGVGDESIKSISAVLLLLLLLRCAACLPTSTASHSIARLSCLFPLPKLYIR